MTNSDPQFLEVIFLNLSFTTFSNHIKVRIMTLKECSFLDVLVVLMSEKHGYVKCPVLAFVVIL